ncbi:MAG: glycosyltransferase family 4 protein [Pelatocladus maniniholoensis HA4357-MV3]|jgi:glycosyltransferase involved in cell wall biosynthesis|uniref:Glycosyltransferase family 4 protein n=1 Tax=Pelatocladus maniniholoensis HA4357-MV3 TaxID=1117104 RepID=A0A9E3H5Z5_9NOST|nr:glycosyltransferase family 4 protein [Pelatocladus maniniholoensis HA4357-MV3]
MRVVIVRTMPNFSMDVYADGLISGLRTVRPDWEIVDLAPHPVDRKSRSWTLRAKKFYERFWGFPGKVQKQPGDIFHIIDHSEAHIINWLKNQGKPAFVTCHDLINFFYRNNLQGSVQLPIISSGMWQKSVQTMRYADHIIAVSSTTAKDTAQILNINCDRIAVVPNAVEAIYQPLPKHQAESFRQQHNISPETFCLLNVGSDHPRKNISTILTVVKILKEQGLPIQFWKAGSDFKPDQKQYIQTHGLENYIKYLGQPDKATLVKIYNAANCLIAPSLHEGFGITIIEAMACGIPVITSQVSAMPEVVDNAGILIDPTNPQEIADAVCRLYSDPVYYQELVEKGLSRVKSFTWEKTAEQIAQIYEKSLKIKATQVLYPSQQPKGEVTKPSLPNST